MEDRMHQDIDVSTGKVTVRPWTEQDSAVHETLLQHHAKHKEELRVREIAHSEILQKVATVAGVSIDDLHAALGLRQGSQDKASS
jgi:hypothetical protein